jgi:hypothetical protein
MEPAAYIFRAEGMFGMQPAIIRISYRSSMYVAVLTELE